MIAESQELTEWAQSDHVRRSIDRILVRVFNELRNEQKKNGGENWEFNSAMEAFLREDIEALVRQETTAECA